MEDIQFGIQSCWVRNLDPLTLETDDLVLLVALPTFHLWAPGFRAHQENAAVALKAAIKASAAAGPCVTRPVSEQELHSCMQLHWQVALGIGRLSFYSFVGTRQTNLDISKGIATMTGTKVWSQSGTLVPKEKVQVNVKPFFIKMTASDGACCQPELEAAGLL